MPPPAATTSRLNIAVYCPRLFIPIRRACYVRKLATSAGFCFFRLGRPDHLPVLLEHRIDPLDAHRDDGEKAGDKPGDRGRPDNVHEYAVATTVILVDRAMQQRVVENEQRIVVPVVLDVAAL